MKIKFIDKIMRKTLEFISFNIRDSLEEIVRERLSQRVLKKVF